MAASPALGSRLPTSLYLLLGVGLVVGVAAGLLTAAAPAPPTPRAGEVEVNLPAVDWGLLFLAPVLVGLAAIFLQQLSTGRGRLAGRAWLTVLVILGVAVAFVYLLALASHPGAAAGSITTGGSGGTTNTTTNTSGGGGGGNGSGSGPVAGTRIVTIHAWELAVAVGALCGAVGLLALPGVLSRLLDRSPRRTLRNRDGERLRLQAAVEDAARALARGASPREAIVALYVRLIRELGRRARDVEPLTAEEIRATVLEPLGVEAGPARELTRLFEEARYSSHPLGPGAVDRCRATLAAVEGDLRRGAAA